MNQVKEIVNNGDSQIIEVLVEDTTEYFEEDEDSSHGK